MAAGREMEVGAMAGAAAAAMLAVLGTKKPVETAKAFEAGMQEAETQGEGSPEVGWEKARARAAGQAVRCWPAARSALALAEMGQSTD